MDFDTFLRCDKSNAQLAILNLSIKIHPSSGTCAFPHVISGSNYHSYEDEATKLLRYHSFYGGHIPPNKKLVALQLKISKFLFHEVYEIPHKTCLATTSFVQNIK